MKASRRTAESELRTGGYALRRGLGTCEVTFEGCRDSFGDEQGAEYVVWLLLHPAPQPIHAAALVLEARMASAGAPADSVGPGFGAWQGRKGDGVWRLLHLRASAGGDVEAGLRNAELEVRRTQCEVGGKERGGGVRNWNCASFSRAVVTHWE
jgi:hypothetical protein